LWFPSLFSKSSLLCCKNFYCKIFFFLQNKIFLFVSLFVLEFTYLAILCCYVSVLCMHTICLIKCCCIFSSPCCFLIIHVAKKTMLQPYSLSNYTPKDWNGRENNKNWTDVARAFDQERFIHFRVTEHWF
jgi:hypothetical protein